MVSFRKPVIEWLEERFSTETLNEMKEVAERQGEKVFGSDYTVEDYEADLDYHEQEMVKAEHKFENYNEMRKEALEDAKKVSSLKRKRYLAKARRMRKRAMKHVKKFVAHLEQFEAKLDELTAHETTAISADENARVDLDETAEHVTDELVENQTETENFERKEADKAIEKNLGELSLDDKVAEEEAALRQMEQEDISAEEFGLEDDIDNFVAEELGAELSEEEEQEEEQEEEEEDTVELDW